MLLEAKNLIKKFGDLTVLDGVSLAVEAGDFVSIVGKSGSGKSTLLTILGGIDRPTEGEVLFHGADISRRKEKELAKLRRTRLGFVFQFFNLAPYLTARENILLPMILNGKTEKSAERKLVELTEYLGIAGLLQKLPAKLSGGEQQRVAIARGLIFEPELILLDEPTGNLDSKTSEEIMLLLQKINRDTGTTVVQVTHSDHNAAFGNRIVEIVDGRIHADRRAAGGDGFVPGFPAGGEGNSGTDRETSEGSANAARKTRTPEQSALPDENDRRREARDQARGDGETNASCAERGDEKAGADAAERGDGKTGENRSVRGDENTGEHPAERGDGEA